MQNRTTSPFTRWMVTSLTALYLVSLAWFTYHNHQAEQSIGNTFSLGETILNAIILSMPLILLYGAIGVLISGARQHAQGGFTRPVARIIYWAPRLAGIIIILFVSLFALDVFEEQASFWEKLGGFFMHMLPSIFMMAVLALAWRWEWVGFGAFMLASLFFLRFVFSPGGIDFAHILLFSGPMLLVALLFGANWRWRRELHSTLA